MPTNNQLKRWKYILDILRKRDISKDDLIRKLENKQLLNGSDTANKKQITRDLKALREEYEAPISRQRDYYLTALEWELPSDALKKEDGQSNRWESIINSLRIFSKSQADLIKELIEEELISGSLQHNKQTISQDIKDLQDLYNAPILRGDLNKYALRDKEWSFPYAIPQKTLEPEYVLAAMAAREVMEGTPSQDLFDHLICSLKKYCEAPTPEKLSKKEKEIFLGPNNTTISRDKTLKLLLEEALEHHRNGRLTDTIRLATLALDIEEDEECLWIRAESYRKEGQYTEAIEDTSKILRHNKTSIKALCTRADSLRMQAKFSDAIDDATKVLKLSSDNAYVLRIRGDCYRFTQEYEKSITDASRALTIEPGNKFALCTRAEAYRLLSNFDKAIKDATHILENIKSTDSKALRTRAMCYCKQGRYIEALDDIENAVSVDDDYYGFQDQNSDPILIWIYTCQKQAETSFINEIIKQTTSQLKKMSSAPSALQKRADAFIKKKNYTTAIKDTTRILKSRPNDLSAFCSRATSYIQLKDYDRCLSDITKALEINKNSSKALCIKAELCNHKKQYNDAIQYADQALKVMPKKARVLLDKAETLKKGKLAAEWKCRIEAFKEMTPENAYAYCMRAWANLHLKDYKKSENDAYMAYQIKPNYTLALLFMTESQYWKGHFNSTIRSATKVLAIEPEEAKALRLRAGSLLYFSDKKRIFSEPIFNKPTEKYERAIQDATRSLKIAPEHPYAYWVCAESYHRIGKYEEAIQNATRALEINSDYKEAKTTLEKATQAIEEQET